MTEQEKQDALIAAINNNDLRSVEELISNGVSINFWYKYKSQLMIALKIENIDIEIIKLLVTEDNINQPQLCILVSRPLDEAVTKNRTDIVKYLLEKRADVNISDKSVDGTLYSAIRYNNIEIVKLLCAYEANIEAKDKCGRTPLFNAYFQGRMEMVDFFIANKANINIIDIFGETILGLAIKTGDFKRVQQLIELNVDIKLFTENKAITCVSNQTHFHRKLDFVVTNNYFEMTEWLLKLDTETNKNTNFINELLRQKIVAVNSSIATFAALEEVPSETLAEHNKKVSSSISMIKTLVMHGADILPNQELITNDKIKSILNAVKIAYKVFKPIYNERDILQNIDLEIFISKFSKKLESYNGKFIVLNRIIGDFFRTYNNHSKVAIANNDTVKLIISKYISCIEKNGFSLSYFESMNNIPSSIKEDVIEYIQQAQVDFNSECATIFSKSLKHNDENIIPVPLIILIEEIKDNYANGGSEILNELTADMQQLIKFYNDNSNLKRPDIESFLMKKTSPDEKVDKIENDAFKAKVTAANNEIFEKYTFTIMKECPSDIIVYLLELPLPIEFKNFIFDTFEKDCKTLKNVWPSDVFTCVSKLFHNYVTGKIDHINYFDLSYEDIVLLFEYDNENIPLIGEYDNELNNGDYNIIGDFGQENSIE